VKERKLGTARILVFILTAGLAIGYGAYRLRGQQQPKVKVGRTVIVRPGEITVRVSENGTLEPVTYVDVKSRVAGRVQKIFVREGDHVRAGQTLAIVDPTEVARQVAGLQAQLAAAQAGLHQAEENYNLTKTQNTLAVARSEAALNEARKRLAQTAAPTRPQEIQQQVAAVNRADAQVEDARRTLARRQALVAKGFIAQAEADSAQTALALAESDLASAKQRLSVLHEGTRQEDVAVARAAVQSAEVQLASDRANLAQAGLRMRDVERSRADVAQNENQLAQQSVQLTETHIVAPVVGEVTGKFVEEGELVASATAGFAQGATIVRIADLTHMQVRVDINEVDVARLKIGLPVEIHADGVPDETFYGKVAAIAPASLSENQSTPSSSTTTSQTGVVRFNVKVAVTRADPRLRPGMTASVSIILDRHNKVLTLPAAALQPGNTVTVVTGDGPTLTKTKRAVKVGLKTDATIEVVEGLKEGDKVEIPTISAPDRRKINVNGPDDQG